MKKILIICIIIVLSVSVSAKQISLQEAEKAADTFLEYKNMSHQFTI